MNNGYWYDIKEENGSILIEKKLINEDRKETYTINKERKRNWKPVFFVLPILLILPFLIMFILNGSKTSNGYKYRTFMIYMVGSDLESTGSIATYDLNDIKGNNIDLTNNNVLLMVGGSKKWHNFVSENEIGLYQLTNTGFKKVKSYNLSSMGSEEALLKFLNYTTDNYESEKYDMIFWNHGLGSIGLEADELFDDYLSINELKNAFGRSKFSKEKLEVVIFNSCMSGNIHIASVMKNYANYMVASEEVMYVGGIINRLDFLDDIEKEDSGYDIGLSYVKKSDASISNANRSSRYNLDSTLSIIDLSKIDEVEKSINNYFESINLDENYNAVSRARRRTITYGEDDIEFDTVDLYSFSNYLESVSNTALKEALQNSIKNAVVYNSSLNSYSKGLSIYFPYYGSEEHITSHLYTFDGIWDNSYMEFIHKYVDLSNKTKRANRAGKEDEVLYLTNEINYIDNNISLELNLTEKENIEDAYLYIFEKSDDKYKLLLKTDEVDLVDNKLIAKDIAFLKSSNNKIISSIKDNGIFKIYGLYNDSNVVIKLSTENGKGIINKVLIDSKDSPVGGLVEYNNEDISYYSISYDIGDTLSSEWNTYQEKELLGNVDNQVGVVGNSLSNYYVLIEVRDVNNDVYYSKIKEIEER